MVINKAVVTAIVAEVVIICSTIDIGIAGAVVDGGVSPAEVVEPVSPPAAVEMANGAADEDETKEVVVVVASAIVNWLLVVGLYLAVPGCVTAPVGTPGYRVQRRQTNNRLSKVFNFQQTGEVSIFIFQVRLL